MCCFYHTSDIGCHGGCHRSSNVGVVNDIGLGGIVGGGECHVARTRVRARSQTRRKAWGRARTRTRFNGRQPSCHDCVIDVDRGK